MPVIVVLEDDIQEMLVLDVLEPVCVYTLISVEMKRSLHLIKL